MHEATWFRASPLSHKYTLLAFWTPRGAPISCFLDNLDIHKGHLLPISNDIEHSGHVLLIVTGLSQSIQVVRGEEAEQEDQKLRGTGEPEALRHVL